MLGAARGSLQGATSRAQDGAADSVRTCALLALTALVTNNQLRLAPTEDGAPLMLAIASAAGQWPPPRAPVRGYGGGGTAAVVTEAVVTGTSAADGAAGATSEVAYR